MICIGAWVLAALFLALPHPFLKVLGALWAVLAFLFTLIMAKFIYYIHGGKLRLRDRILSLVDWRGDERVLDIGTGRGLLMIGAAKKLTGGRSVGIDIWSQVDMYQNDPKNTLQNAQLEGVLDRVEVQNADARKMPFPDASFDVVLSNLCLHNIPTPEGREEACREIVRVLKPGGKAVLADPIHLGDYARVFRNAGMTVSILPAGVLETIHPFHRILIASR